MIRLPRTANRSNFCDKSKCHIKRVHEPFKHCIKNNIMKENFIWLGFNSFAFFCSPFHLKAFYDRVIRHTILET